MNPSTGATSPILRARTPGYPLFLAACQVAFGRRTLAARLIQACLGTLSVFLVYQLTQQFANTAKAGDPSPTRGWTAPLLAAAIAAANPYYIFMSAILLSEAVFVPLMLAALWGVAVLWVEPGRSATRRVGAAE